MDSKRPRLVIWGAGGHASVVADLIRVAKTHEIVAFVEHPQYGQSTEFAGVPVLRRPEELARLAREGPCEAIIAIGDCAARLRLASEPRALGFRLCTAVHPRAVVSPGAKLGAGTVIAAGAVVGPGAVLGENVIVNTCASVDHDCVVEDGAHICPGAHLAGGVSVGRGVWVGIGSAVVDKVRIGEGACIGAGAVVVKPIPEFVLAYGVPARVIRTLTDQRTG